MIKYFCNACGKEINETYMHRIELESTIINKYTGDGSKPHVMHFHETCLNNMFEYLERIGKDEW